VLEAGVAGVPDADGLPRVYAFVILKAGWTGSSQLAVELTAFVRARTAAYKAPAAVHFVDELPKTATGKIQRFRLRERAS
jgi:benzoate-CoA ligase